MHDSKGKLIVIDGTDGSGKATQVALLAERLKKAGFDVELADFPQYGRKSAGAVEEYLSGKYGSAEMVSPYAASIFYATDRYDASFKIKKWLDEGKLVISNRYTTSNMAHQGGKISNPLERKAFFDWIKNFEEKILGIPKPNLVFFLHVNSQLAQNMAIRRNRVDWDGKIRDIHEENIRHLELAEKTYVEIAQSSDDIILFSCVKDGQLLSRSAVNDLLWEKIIGLLSPQTNHDITSSAINDSPLKCRVDANPIIKIRRISEHARLPERSADGNGLYLYSDDYHSIPPNESAEFRTGVSLILPENFAGIIMNYDQSEIKEISVLPFIVSSGFDREIIIKVLNTSQDMVHISPGRIIAKLIIQKTENPLIVKDDYDLF
jgi:dTMP kinase